MFLTIDPICAFTDNYIWAIRLPNGNSCYVVDPGDAAPVEDYLEQQGLTLAGILVTHHHPDHVGGVSALCSGRDIPVYGPAGSPKAALFTHLLKDNQTFHFDGVECLVLAVPAHTLDHIAYLVSPHSNHPLLFCGDTLFAAGCGRLFEGTAKQLYTALQRIQAVPDNTLIYPTHEYTLANLAFAVAVEPNNLAIKQRQHACLESRKNHLPTLPTTLPEERETNPFLRIQHPSVKHSVENFSNQTLNCEVDLLGALRGWKDRF